MDLTGVKFKIGNLDGEYPAGTSITDSIFEHMSLQGADILTLTYESQCYPQGWTITGRKLDFSGIFSTSNQKIVVVTFTQPVKIA